MKLEEHYLKVCDTKSDINEHIPTLYKYSTKCNHITEMGVRGITSTWAFLYAFPKTLISYDLYNPSNWGGNIDEVYEVALENNINFSFHEKNVLEVDIEETDLLFIDTLHQYNQLKQELKKHANKVKKYIIFHDTHKFGTTDEIERPNPTDPYGVVKFAAGIDTSKPSGLIKVIDEFLESNPKWKRKEVYKNNNGLTIIEKMDEFVDKIII